ADGLADLRHAAEQGLRLLGRKPEDARGHLADDEIRAGLAEQRAHLPEMVAGVEGLDGEELSAGPRQKHLHLAGEEDADAVVDFAGADELAALGALETLQERRDPGD